MEVTLPLLGTINKNVAKDAPLRPKYVVRITAERLAQLLIYERKGKKKNDPYKILPISLIKIDKDIQRGFDQQGFHLQQPNKIHDIANTILGDPAASVPRAYLGSLIWNVRDTEQFHLAKREIEGRPTEWELTFNTDAIYLTDSAHRHFGIVEAYRQFMADPSKHPKFRKDFEFSVEIYNLDKAGEKELFSELNAKQKKITAAKQKEMDVSSPIGALKDAILEYDQQNRRIFENSIEVSSNKNDKHTLMTMSVFVASIDEMFSAKDIREAREDEDIRAELAEYYCQFTYQLHDRLVVRCDVTGNGQEEDVRPFSNLWLEIIKPAEDSYDETTPQAYEERLDKARQDATKRNQRLRATDISNHNGTVKALYKLGGIIRNMPDWRHVINRLQTDLVIPLEGKFFQKSNQDLFSKDSDADIPIASLNEDGTINLQVQTKNIVKLHRYLRQRLGLEIDPIITFRQGADQSTVLHPKEARAHWVLSKTQPNLRSVEVRFVGPRGESSTDELPLLAIRPSAGVEWRDATLTGAKRLKPIAIRQDASFADPHYEGLVRWAAFFEVKLPAAQSLGSNPFSFELEVSYPELNGSERKFKVLLGASAE
ncbi:MAG TPA: hypothetical protein VEY88_20075 [Archangium sp.]|nr:hypothetical protein [Archangium sp.]